MNIFAMMRLYVCCEHCATMVSWSQFWSGLLVKTCAASLIASPDHRRVILHVNTKSSWSKGSFDHTTSWRSVHMWSSREAVPYAWSSEYDQRDICSAHITMTKRVLRRAVMRPPRVAAPRVCSRLCQPGLAWVPGCIQNICFKCEYGVVFFQYVTHSPHS